MKKTMMISITIDSVRGVDLSRLDRRDVMGKTATVSFSGSIAKMKIGTSRLCTVSGYPVVESRPVVSTTSTKVSWGTKFSHLTLNTAVVPAEDRRQPDSGASILSSSSSSSLERTTTSQLSSWSDQKLPEILELRVRLGLISGVCHLVIGNNNNLLAPVQDLPVRSTDDALATAFLRVRVNFLDDDAQLPGIINSSSSNSSSSSTSIAPPLETATKQQQQHLDLRTLVGGSTAGPRPVGRSTTAGPSPPRVQAAASRGCSTGFSFRDLRRAVWACQPGVIVAPYYYDDSSTIATHESWDM